MKRKYPLIIILFLGSVIATGQNHISMNDFLATAHEQQEIVLGEQTNEYLKTTNYNLPLVEKLEFRTESHDFDISKQEFALRLTPNSLSQRKYQRLYHQSTILRSDLDQVASLNDALVERYLVTIEYLYYYHLIDIRKRMQKIYLEKVEVLKSSIDQSNFDIIDLVNAEEKLFDQEWELLDMDGSLKLFKNHISQLSNGADSIQIDQFKLIKPDQIESLIISPPSESLPPSLMLSMKQSKIDQVQLEYNMERAKANRVLGFLQAKYWGWENEYFNDAISLGLELRIPVRGEAKLSLNELELEQIEAENEYQLLQSEITTLQQEVENRLSQLMKQYRMMVDQFENSYALKILEQENISEAVGPIDLIKMKELLLEKELTIEKLNHRILIEYIDWLDLTGKIIETPLKNQLLAIPEPF